MTYLTLLELSQDSRAASRDLANSHEMHRTLVRLALGGEEHETPRHGTGRTTEPRKQLGLLYRIDKPAGEASEQLRSGATVTVLSRAPLSVSCAPDDYLADVQKLDFGAYLDSLRQGELVRYTLVASPVRNLRHDPEGNWRSRGRKVPLRSPTSVADWWLERMSGDRPGGTVSAMGLMPVPNGDGTGLALDVRNEPLVRARKLKDGKATTIARHGTRINGLATVTDPQTLRRSVEEGVGPGKAYGAGLLTVVRRGGQ